MTQKEPKKTFVLDVHDLDAAGRNYTFELSPSWLNAALQGSDVTVDPQGRSGTLEVHAHKSGADVIVQGSLSATVLAECGRCLGPARIEIDTPVDVLMSARGDQYRPPADEIELTPEDLNREFFTGDRVVLDDLIREHILLEVPMQPLCSETCPGIQLPEGGDAGPAPPREEPPIDPRLAPLRDLAIRGLPKKE